MTCSGCGTRLRDDARICLGCGEVVRVKTTAPTVPVDARGLGIPVWIGAGHSTDNGTSVRAGRFPRIMAVIVDLVIVNLVTAPIYLLFFRDRLDALSSHTTGEVDWLLTGLSLGFLGTYLVVFPLTKLRATPGKHLFGMRVVDSDGDPITIGQSLTRSFFLIVFLTVVFPLAAMFAAFGAIGAAAGFIFIIGDGGSPWDSLAGTRVID